jgi:hypothetical protein
MGGFIFVSLKCHSSTHLSVISCTEKWFSLKFINIKI